MTIEGRTDGASGSALDAVAEASRALTTGGTLREALASIAAAAASATGAEVVVARVLAADARQLKAHAVWAVSPAVAAELEGSRFAVEELPAAEVDEVARLPKAVQLAAERARAGAVLQVPIVLDDAVLASLELMRPRMRFSADERVLARLFAHQIGLAIRAFGAHGAAGERDGANGTLELAGEALAAGSDELRTAEQVTRLATDATGALGALLWRAAEADAGLELLGSFGLQAAEPAVARAGEAAERALADPQLAPAADAVAEAGIEAAVALPLHVHDDVIGLFAVYPPRRRPPSTHEAAFLSALASQLAVAVQNAQLHERAKRLGVELESALGAERQAARQLRALYEISRSFAQTLSLETTLEAVARTVVELLEVDAAVIRMPDERRELLVSRAIHVADPRLDEAVRAVLARPQPLEKLLGRRLFRMGKSLRIDAETAARLGSSYELLVPFLERGSTAAVVPVATPAEVLATLLILSLDPARPLEDATVETALAIAGQAALAIDNARLYQQQKDFADTMQRSLLPRVAPDLEGLELCAVVVIRRTA